MATVPNPIILKHVTDYFIKVFPNSPPAAFTPGLKIRKAFKLGTWKALADTFNSMAWMKAIGKMISQQDMGAKEIVTISDVALLITNAPAGSSIKLTGAEFPRARRLTVAAAMKANS